MFKILAMVLTLLSQLGFSMENGEPSKLIEKANNGDVPAMIDLGIYYIENNNKKMALYYLEKCDEQQKNEGGNLYAKTLIKLHELRN